VTKHICRPLLEMCHEYWAVYFKPKTHTLTVSHMYTHTHTHTHTHYASEINIISCFGQNVRLHVDSCPHQRQFLKLVSLIFQFGCQLLGQQQKYWLASSTWMRTYIHTYVYLCTYKHMSMGNKLVELMCLSDVCYCQRTAPN